MHVDGILQSLRELNAAKPKKKPAPPAKKKANGSTTFDADEALRITVGRVVKAFGLEEKGATVEQVVAAVKRYEAPWEGVVQ